MMEFYTTGFEFIINFQDHGKIIMSDNKFKIEGNTSGVAIQLAKYLYSYTTNESGHIHPEMHKFTDNRHIIHISFGNAFANHLNVDIYLPKNNKKFKIDLLWEGDDSEQWQEFKNTFDRYFSLKSFL